MTKFLFSPILMLTMMFSCNAPVPPPVPVLAKVGLKWNAVSVPNVTYRVYRGAKTGGPYSQVVSGLTTTTYTDPKVSHGATYFYVARSFNGMESGNSNELKVAVP